jgi:cation:H+ antiporter
LTLDILTLVFYLLVIVAASEIFTNAVESVGKGLNLSEGVSGSIFAAVGTALPETMVPLVAVLTGRGEQVHEEVGVGAILGAPFMLSTLAVFLTGAAAWRFAKRRKKTSIEPEQGGLRRDLGFFLFSFTLALLVAFAPYEMRVLRVIVALVLISTYVFYVYKTLKASPDLVKEGHHTEARRALYLSVLFREHLILTLAQMAIALGLIIIGAKGFVRGLEALGEIIHIPVIALSLLIIPIATELPEKINSIIWIRHGKDTLAVGNITGAMVFQGSLLPAIGIFLTPWTINPTVLTNGAITITAALWLFALAHRAKKIRPIYLVVNGVLYTLFLVFTISMTFHLKP